MLSALISTAAAPDARGIGRDLERAGLTLLGDVECSALVQEAVRSAPDVVICFDAPPRPALFDALAALAATAPRPVIVFTSDPDADRMEAALRAGTAAYVVGGYDGQRLRSIVHLAFARFRRDRALLDELAALRQRFAERTLVDRAKGILMGARQLREEDAYQALRQTAMRSKQRLGQVAQTIIDSAHYAEAVNRAGLFRMLSQRLVKLYALDCAGLRMPGAEDAAASSVALAEENMAALRARLSRPTFGDLIEAVAAAWSPLRAGLAQARLERLEDVDTLAGSWLRNAERLTDNLEVAAFAPALHVVNVAGRQRMLSQKLAKEALLAALLADAAAARNLAALARTRHEFNQGIAFLGAVPLRTASIDGELAAARDAWATLEAVLDGTADDRLLRIATLSERLLLSLSSLTDQYEAGIHALLDQARSPWS